MPEVELKTLHLTEPFRIAHGSSTSRQVLRLHERGAVGEAPFVPYLHANPEDTMAWLEGNRGVEGSQAARLALDLLQLDQGGQPLWRSAEKILGQGKPWDAIRACRSLGIPTDLAAFALRVRETARQFGVLKLKLGSGDLDHDESIVATARAEAPHATLFADVNGGWSVGDTVSMMTRLQRFGLVLIEQPVHHEWGIGAWAELKARSPAAAPPVFADESARNSEDVRLLAGLVGGINVKLAKCGSFGGAVEMILTARELGLGVIVGCMIESSIGVTAAAHLAPWADFADLDGHLYLSDDDYRGIKFDENGRIIMPRENGIGARPLDAIII